MSLAQFSKEEIQEMSLIEVAYELLAEKKQAISFAQLMDELAQILEMSEEEVKARIAQFYTDLNIDGRFLCVGENQWGLRIWYPVDQVTEEIVNPVKAKKKKKKAKKLVDEDFDDIEALEEEEFVDLDEFDDDEDLDEEDDEDLLDDDDLDEVDEELDDDLLDDDLDEDLDEDLGDEIDDDEFELDDEEREFDDEEEDL